MNHLIRGAVRFTLPLIACLTISACDWNNDSNHNDSAGSAGNGGDSTAQSQAAAQKGPFQSGATVTLKPLNANGSPGSDSATTSTDERGGFDFPETAWTGPTLVSIQGTFYNEVTGNFTSPPPWLLTGVTDLGGNNGDGRVHVNLYTQLVQMRTSSLMGQGDSFSDARDQARTELENLVGLGHAPADLDLLDAIADNEDDSANLLLFSAALLKAGVDQADFTTLGADFADDGAINGSGEAVLQRIQQAAANNPDLLNTARLHLTNQYSSTPPNSLNSGFGWTLNGCEAAKLTDRRVVCVDSGFAGHINGSDTDSGKLVKFIPPETGHYTIELFGDAEKNNANVNRCSYTVYNGSDPGSASDVGNSDYTDGFCGVEDVTHILTGGETYYIEPNVSLDDSGSPGYFYLSVSINSEGEASSGNAVVVTPGKTHYGHVGSLNSTAVSPPSKSFYKFTASPGNHEIMISRYPCAAGNGTLSLVLFDPGEGQQAFDYGARVETSGDEACSQTIATSLDGGEYYLMVENDYTNYNSTAFRPAPGSIGFDLNIDGGSPQ